MPPHIKNNVDNDEDNDNNGDPDFIHIKKIIQMMTTVTMMRRMITTMMEI